MYGPWMSVARQKPARAGVIGGCHAGSEHQHQAEPWKSWFDIKSEAKEGEKNKGRRMRISGGGQNGYGSRDERGGT